MQEFRIFRALGLSFRVWFRNFLPFALLTAVLYSPVFLWIAAIDPLQATSADELVDKLFTWPIYMLVGLSTLLAPLLTYRVVQDLNGTTVSIWTSMKLGLRGIVPAAIVALLTNLLQQIPMGGIVGAVLMCMWFVAAPSAVAEKLGPFAAFSRSAALTSGRRWGIFGLTLLLGLAVFALLMLWIVPMMEGLTFEDLPSIKRSAILFAIVLGVFQMFYGIVEAVAYALLRKDKEGVTHEQLAAIFE